MTNQMVKWMTVSVIILVALIGAGSFILSYGALLSIGIMNGMPDDWRGYIWPLLTDAGLIVFTLALLTAQLMRQRVELWVAGVVFLSAASMAYNVAHAPMAGKTAYGIALTVAVTIWPPLMLVLTTEALRHLVKTAIERQGVIVTMTALGSQKADLEKQVKKLEVKLAAQTEQADRQPPPPDDGKRQAEERRQRVELAVREGITSVSELARLVEVSETTIRRDLVALNGRIAK